MPIILQSRGYASVTSHESGRVVREQDTLTCVHCNAIVYLDPDPKKREIFGCQPCHGPVCAKCHAKGTCTPFEKRLAAYEAMFARRRNREQLFEACGL